MVTKTFTWKNISASEASIIIERYKKEVGEITYDMTRPDASGKVTLKIEIEVLQK